ncbi:MAG: hypothetical protein WCT31_01160 [Candidatus Micrarchaeia archaeon]
MSVMMMAPKTQEDAVNLAVNIKAAATQGMSILGMSTQQAQELYQKYAPQIDALISMAPDQRSQNVVIRNSSDVAREAMPGTGSEVLLRAGGATMVGMSAITAGTADIARAIIGSDNPGVLAEVKDATKLIGETLRDNHDLKTNFETSLAQYAAARLDLASTQVSLVTAILNDDSKSVAMSSGILLDKAKLLQEKANAVGDSIARVNHHSQQVDNAVGVVKDYLKDSGLAIVTSAALAGVVSVVGKGIHGAVALDNIALATGGAKASFNVAKVGAVIHTGTDIAANSYDIYHGVHTIEIFQEKLDSKLEEKNDRPSF